MGCRNEYQLIFLVVLIFLATVEASGATKPLNASPPKAKSKASSKSSIKGSNISGEAKGSKNIGAPKAIAHIGAVNSSYCHRPWPELELILPVAILSDDHDRKFEWRDIFLKSFLFYWPLKISKTKLRIIIDHDVPEDLLNRFRNDMKDRDKLWEFITPSKINGGLSITTNQFDPVIFHENGHVRQQLLMFWADTYRCVDCI